MGFEFFNITYTNSVVAYTSLKGLGKNYKISEKFTHSCGPVKFLGTMQPFPNWESDT